MNTNDIFGLVMMTIFVVGFAIIFYTIYHKPVNLFTLTDEVEMVKPKKRVY